MRNALLILLLVLVAVSLIGFWLARFYFFSSENRETKKTTLLINGQELQVEIADSFLKRQQGLVGRTTLAENQGMLFVFEKPGRYSFWMKDMRFSLDFIWLKDNQVLETSENVPAPQNAAESPVVVKPQQPVDKVLEVNAGTVKRLNISTGDKIAF